MPVPSQVLRVSYRNAKLDITLDSGATVSYLRLIKAHELSLPILPNDQLAMLADKKTRIKSVGEVDFLATVDNISLRIRALVMEDLQAECFGGTTFHVDNNIVTNIKEGTICLHGKFTLNQTNHESELPLFPPPSETIHCIGPDSHAVDQKSNEDNGSKVKPSVVPNKLNAVSLPTSKVIYPGDSLLIPLSNKLFQAGYVSISPSFPEAYDNKLWQPQICEILNGIALYKNFTSCPLVAPKNCHFRPHPVTVAAITDLKPGTNNEHNRSLEDKGKILHSKTSSWLEDIAVISINRDILSYNQVAKLHKIH